MLTMYSKIKEESRKLETIKEEPLKVILFNYIQNATDYFKDIPANQLQEHQKSVRELIDYVLGLRTVWEFKMNPYDKLNVLMWKALEKHVIHQLKDKEMHRGEMI